ncbi:MAG: GNAT family N-acetyltransferase [Cellulomonas sp.]|nr:GNAT family N-acetyltransferase [Cellulomonas sp.]
MQMKRADFADPQVLALLRDHLHGMSTSSPPGAVYALDLTGLQDPAVELWCAWEAVDLLGCGALKALGPRQGELKSMRTAAAHLRRGVGGRILGHLLDLARARGYHGVSLETGSGLAFEPALTLYCKAGFRPGPAFADYHASAFNQFLHLDLEPRAGLATS